MDRNLLLTVEYDGTDFHGWQRQPGLRTVQGELERVLSVLCGGRAEAEGTSRTDAGVHALDQKVTLRGNFGIPAERLPFAANNLLERDVRIIRAEEKPAGFHARFDCTGKTYIYILSGERSVFAGRYKWQLKELPDISLMKEAAGYIPGTRDFACFRASGDRNTESTVRTVSSLEVEEKGRDIRISITGDGFLYNMVRIITGTLVEAGYGRRSPASLREVIDSGDRAAAGPTAPPQGLYLAKVYYGDENGKET